jgi:hypothetical protein
VKYERKQALASVCLIPGMCPSKVGYNVLGLAAVLVFEKLSAGTEADF